jgi:hypothetical protein
MGRVPLARRNLLAEPRRLLAGVAGIGLALMLILLLGGLWAGIQAQSARYVDATGAALWVLPPGTRTLFAEGTQPSASTLETVRRTALQACDRGPLGALLGVASARTDLTASRAQPGAWNLPVPAADLQTPAERTGDDPPPVAEAQRGTMKAPAWEVSSGRSGT